MRTKLFKKIASVSVGLAMLGSTMTGALALSYSLSDYPSPFINPQTGIFSGVITVGKNAAASDTIGQSVLLSDLQAKAISKTSETTVAITGGIIEDIPLGEKISNTGAITYSLDSELSDDDISGLFDGSINFKGSDYDVSEVLYLNQANNSITVETSLTASEDDYLTDVVLEVAKESIKYYYSFDEAIPVSNATTADPLEIKFLGKTLRVTDIKSNNEFTAYVGTEYFLNSGDSVTANGKTVKLVRVGSAGGVVVDVDGVQETISASQVKTINGIEIKNDDTFYDSSSQTASAANLIIGKDAIETYTDGEAYAGEDKDNPNWVWNVGNLESDTSTTLDENTVTGSYFGIENDFTWNDDADNPPKVGQCIELPNNYLSICLDSLTVSDDNNTNYAEYTFEYEPKSDLSDVNSALTAARTIYIHTAKSEGLVVDQGDLNDPEGTSFKDLKTNQIWLYTDDDGVIVDVYYKDNSNKKVKLAGSINTTDARYFAHINYDNTKDTDIRMVLEKDGSENNLVLVPFDGINLPNYNDNITMNWGTSGNKFDSLGDDQSEEEISELKWQGTNLNPTTSVNIGTKNKDQRSRYGIIIRDPRSHGSSDEVVLDIPGNQVQANIVVKGMNSISNTSSSGVVNKISSNAVALDTEITDVKAQNLILVGGPAVHKLVEPIFGLTVADFTPNEAIIKLVDNGEFVALLVAGYSAVDTRNAANSIVSGKLKDMNKAEAKVTSATQTLDSYTIE